MRYQSFCCGGDERAIELFVECDSLAKCFDGVLFNGTLFLPHDAVVALKVVIELTLKINYLVCLEKQFVCSEFVFMDLPFRE